MSNWIEDELKIERSKESRVDVYQQYHAHLVELKANETGEMRGKRFKKLDPIHHSLNALFSHSVSRI